MSEANGASGLVHSATSGKQAVSHPMIDPLARRLGRMQRVVKTAARLVAEEVGSTHRAAMVTLTYRPEVEWSPRHISEFLAHVRKWFDRREATLRYVWVLEKTKAGRPHYHVLIWLRRGHSMPKPDKQGWWRHGSTRIEWARRAVGYIAKYASKAEESFKVKGARLYGVGGIHRRDRDHLAFWRLSKWLRERIPFGTRADRIRFCGWVSRDTGEIFQSPWAVVVVRGLLRLLPRTPEVMPCGMPS